MPDHPNFKADFLAHRLHGESPPPDLSVLLEHPHELARLAGIVLNASAEWAPWLDTSYLTERDWADPAIRANVRAISDVCKLVTFMFEDEDRNYFGYWRGPAHLLLSEAPLVYLDNEGQVDFCGVSNIAGAILTRAGPSFEELRSWFVSLGIGSLPSGPYDLFDVQLHPSPRQLHESLYEKYATEERTA